MSLVINKPNPEVTIPGYGLLVDLKSHNLKCQSLSTNTFSILISLVYKSTTVHEIEPMVSYIIFRISV